MKHYAAKVLLVLTSFALSLNSPLASSSRPVSNTRTANSHYLALRMFPVSDDAEELRKMAAEAFESLSPATKEKFMAAAGKHPPGPFDSSWAAKTLATEFATGSGAASPDELMVCLMAYLKDVAREQRENQDFRRAQAKQVLGAKEARINAETKAIDQGREEASQRFDNAMSAAEREMWSGMMDTLCSTLQTGIGPLVEKKAVAKCVDKNLQQAVTRKLRAQLVKLRAAKA